jgi:hypothetical protein
VMVQGRVDVDGDAHCRAGLGIMHQTGLVDAASCTRSRTSTTMTSMRHVRRTEGATGLSAPSRLQRRSGSRAVDDVLAGSDAPGG